MEALPWQSPRRALVPVELKPPSARAVGDKLCPALNSTCRWRLRLNRSENSLHRQTAIALPGNNQRLWSKAQLGLQAARRVPVLEDQDLLPTPDDPSTDEIDFKDDIAWTAQRTSGAAPRDRPAPA